MNNKKSLGDFIKDINREVVSAVISKEAHPLYPEKKFSCFMRDIRVQFTVGVTAEGNVTSGNNAIAQLHFDYQYIPEVTR